MREWWRGAVIYQIYPRSFQDDSGDGVGDLPGIIRRLDHVAGLGADAIWLSPIFPSPMADMGYDVSDYEAVDPLFGTMADFDALVARAHELGLRVIIDQVLSHTSDEHPWFVESRRSREGARADWYVWTDPRADGTPPNNWLSTFGGSAWMWEPRRRQYYLHNFLAAQPDLNFHQPAVQDALLAAMRFWLDRGVDGFRLDTVNFYFHDDQLRDNPPAPVGNEGPPVNPYDMQDHRFSKNQPQNIAFLNRMRALLDDYDARMMVGEIGEALHSTRLMGEYTQGSDRLHMAYSFDLLKTRFGAEYVASRIAGFFEAAPDGWPCWSFSNHDVKRHVTRWEAHGAGRAPFAKVCAALLTSFEGTLCLYQGEELGQTETDIEYHELTDPPGFVFWPDDKGRDGCRTPMVWEAGVLNGGFSTARPWLPVKGPQLANAVSEQKGPDAVMSAYRGLLKWRRTQAPLREGRTRFHALAEPLLAFDRAVDGDGLTCVFNLGPEPARLTLAGPATLVGPHGGMSLDGTALTFEPNGYGWLKGSDGNGVAFT